MIGPPERAADAAPPSARPPAGAAPVAGAGELFRAAFRRHAAGVALVTCPTPEGPTGLTASSVASVSADPPMLSFSVLRTATAAGPLLAAERLAVTLLAEGDVPVARAFAGQAGERFDPGHGWVVGHDGLPRLATAPAVIVGRPAQAIEAGQSWLVLVEVVGVELGPPGAPLIYWDRAYRGIARPAAGAP